MVNNPIYKDTFYTFSQDDVRFRIQADGATVYEGRSKAKPDGVNKININRICANYLYNTFEGVDLTVLQSTLHSDACRTFTLQRLTADTWSTVETFQFLWDYDNLSTINFSSNNTLSVPVNGHYPATGLYQYTTIFNGSTVVTTPSAVTGAYCGDYGFIYRNLKGGWDSFLFEGKCKRSDNFSLSQMKKDYNNNLTEFGKYTYLNQLVGKWELNTGYMNDAESERFARYLASSTECYLVDFKNSLIIPVVITDTQVNYKTMVNDGQDSPYYYTINVESSQQNDIF